MMSVVEGVSCSHILVVTSLKMCFHKRKQVKERIIYKQDTQVSVYPHTLMTSAVDAYETLNDIRQLLTKLIHCVWILLISFLRSLDYREGICLLSREVIS